MEGNILKELISKRRNLISMNKPGNHQSYLEIEFKNAFKNNQLEIYYQPLVSTEGVILSAEALLRWNHPTEGFISPARFIPIAEKSKLINDITDWMIEEICKQLRTWKDSGLQAVPVSFNLSPIRISQQGLSEYIEWQLNKYSIRPHLLEVELTESYLFKKIAYVAETLNRLKELGIKIALDDFGTGYASLEVIQRFHIDKIKIDRLFISNLDITNKKNTAILSAVFYLSRGLDLKVVAEGVEKLEQLEYLKEYKCDFIQGYLYSKPVPADTFEKLLRVGYITPLIK